jgi:hypothetical protein
MEHLGHRLEISFGELFGSGVDCALEVAFSEGVGMTGVI